MRKWMLTLLTLGLLAAAGVVPAVALADLAAPWNGQPVSPGLGPTYGEPWPVAPPADEAASLLQGAPLAIMPYADIAPVLAQIQAEAAAAGIPQRMTWWVTGKSAAGRDMYVVVINALETDAQTRDYDHWQTIRRFSLTDPAHAQKQVATWGGKVKMPIYIEANINGTEYEGTDAMMQVIRDLSVTPYGQNETVDKLLDHCVLVIVPTANPDGRVMGIRGNSAVADTNRDYFVQSQPEEKIDAAIQQQYLAPGALHLHGYVTPTLIDGLTIPHNPALEYDIFGKWNQARTAQNKIDFNAMGLEIQRPVNDYDANGSYLATGHSTQRSIASGGATQVGTTVTITMRVAHGLAAGDVVTVAGVGPFYGGYNGTFTVTAVPTTTTFTYEASPGLVSPSSGGYVWTAAYGPGTAPGPAVAQSWDDWGPFYGQTYMAFLGVDGSTIEMSSATRMVAKTCQYMAFYSSANFWLDNRQAMFNDQLEVFRRGVVNAPLNPLAIAGVPSLVALGFTDAIHNWMVEYPKAYIIPFGAGQRSDAEANRLVDWLLVNGVRVERSKQDFMWKGVAFKAGSYIVPMNQALRGLAWDALAGGTDIQGRISILYASPAAWSHGLVWGADTFEVPRNDATFCAEDAAGLGGQRPDGRRARRPHCQGRLVLGHAQGRASGPGDPRRAEERRDGRAGRGAVHEHDRRRDAGRHAHLPGRQRHGDEARRSRPADRLVDRAQRGRRQAGHDQGGRVAEDRHPDHERHPDQGHRTDHLRHWRRHRRRPQDPLRPRHAVCRHHRRSRLPHQLGD